MAESYSKVNSLLEKAKGIEIIKLDREDECCGFGGTFSIFEPAISAKMGKERINDPCPEWCRNHNCDRHVLPDAHGRHYPQKGPACQGRTYRRNIKQQPLMKEHSDKALQFLKDEKRADWLRSDVVDGQTEARQGCSYRSRLGKTTGTSLAD